jgi:1-phosphofructokinase family hexose kinase
MILVVCPNLAVDVTLEVEAFRVGGVHRARASRRQAGGKGVNAARALRALGEDPLVLGFAGGRAGEEIARGLESENIARELVPFEGESRTCTIVLATNGIATVVNEAGPLIEDATGLLARFDALLGKARAVALMGSLPPGIPADTHAAMVSRARDRGRFCLLDSSGAALRHGIAARPSVAKPNLAEAEELLERKLESEASRLDAVRDLRRLGADVGIVTLGAEGFLVGDGSLLGRCSVEASGGLRLGNPTGAGDALAAGFLAGTLRGYATSDCARLAAAAAAASLGEGYGRIRAKDIRVEAARLEIAAD